MSIQPGSTAFTWMLSFAQAVASDLVSWTKPPLLEPYLVVDGIAQRQDGVISVRAIRAQGLPALGHHVPSHDFG